MPANFRVHKKFEKSEDTLYQIIEVKECDDDIQY